MGKKLKVLGPSNDAIPEDEMALAKILQTAKALGLKPTRGTFFRDENGRAIEGSETDLPSLDRVCKACAMGAEMFDPDRPVTNNETLFHHCVVDGNDDGGKNLYTEGHGVDIGIAYQQAMR